MVKATLTGVPAWGLARLPPALVAVRAGLGKRLMNVLDVASHSA